jgi:tetratricopeptide (TPR) repeat protein
MKLENIKKESFILLILLEFCVLTKVLADSQTTIYTPQGSIVPDTYICDEMSPSEIAALNKWATNTYPNAILISNASSTYNCHGYAWYVSEGGSPVWIGYNTFTAEDIYWQDNSYVEQSSETNGLKVSYLPDNQANHSAITTSQSGIFISKWGPGPLMQHAYYYCPYWYAGTTYLKYYKRNNVYGVPADFSTITVALMSVQAGQTVVVAAINHNVYSNAQINNGITLKINTGSYLNFYNGSSLIVNGTLNADGATFDFISPSGSNGIKFNSGSDNSIINQCVIKNASRGVECNGVLPIIQNSTFTNNSSGIWLNNIGTITKQIYNNSIQYSTAHGIALYYSSPHIAKNYIYGNNNGIFALGSSPYIYDNYFMNNSYGVYLVNQSSPNIMGYSGYYANALVGNSTAIYADGQCNAYINGNNVDIYSSYAVRANNPNLVVAINNWWGMYPPNPDYFYATNGAQIYYLPASASPFPNNYYPQLGKRSSVVVDNINTEHNNSEPSGFSLNENLAKAIHLKIDGKYEEAVSIYIKELRRDRNIERRKYILSQIADCYRILGKGDFIDLLDNETKNSLSDDNELYVWVLELENMFLINNRKYDTGIKNLVTLKENYSQYENVEKNALFNLGYIYSELLKDKLNSRIYFSELKEKYPEDILTYNAMLITGETETIPEILPKRKIPDNKHKSEIIGMYNYPNPFNPTTVISYQLPEKNFVTIKIYDILGREVATLVNEFKEAGNYRVEFSADKYQLSSGIYFYTLKAGKNYAVKKMMLAK